MSKNRKGKAVQFSSKEGTDITDKKTGKTVRLLNPDEKSRKYATELKFGYAKTNRNETKRTANGKAIKLTNTQLAYRAGYIDRGKDSAKCFNATHKR